MLILCSQSENNKSTNCANTFQTSQSPHTTPYHRRGSYSSLGLLGKEATFDYLEAGRAVRRRMRIQLDRYND